MKPLLLIWVGLFCLASCHKMDARQGSDQTVDATDVSQLLNGQLFSGNVEVVQENNDLVFIYNKGEVLFCIEKLSSENLGNCGNINHAAVIYSDYGIIVKDTDTNKTWAYVVNTPESLQKFREAGFTTGNDQFSIIYGTTKINQPT